MGLEIELKKCQVQTSFTTSNAHLQVWCVHFGHMLRGNAEMKDKKDRKKEIQKSNENDLAEKLQRNQLCVSGTSTESQV